VSLQQEFEVLRRVPFFADIEPSKLKLLAFMSERVGFDDGKVVCRQGDPGDAAYLIIDGEADIVLEGGPSGPLTVATLGANEIVGEMSILTGAPRNATVRAKGRLVALRIAKDPFMRMVREFPAMAVSIMQELAHRVESRCASCASSRARPPTPRDRGSVSRLDSFIRRLEAQRAVLNRAAELIEGVDGTVLELGLGNGRTYDHLRELFADRDIYVCERRVAAHPDCIPPDHLLLLGDMFDTLPAARDRLGGRVALAHFDAGTGDAAGNLRLAAGLRPLILPLLCVGAVLATQQVMDGPGLQTLPLPEGVPEGRYHLYRRV
jgi:CRP-like cAMP-binding protein